MGLLSRTIVPQLKQAFPAETLSFPDGDEPFAIIEPRWPGFGSIELHDDIDEVTIHFGNFTHVHCGNFDRTLREEEKTVSIADQVIQLLDDTFSDRLRFWSNRFGGGCAESTRKIGFLERRKGTQRGLWSKSLT